MDNKSKSRRHFHQERDANELINEKSRWSIKLNNLFPTQLLGFSYDSVLIEPVKGKH